MNSIAAEIARLHNELAELYRGGSVDTLQINRLWARINQLEDELAVELPVID